MKIIILKNNLKTGLDIVGRSVGSNSNLPIVSNILIRTKENKVELVSTNLEVASTATVSGKVVEDGGVTVPYDVFYNIVSNISSERINLEEKNNNLLISTDNYEASIQGIAESEFPIIPKMKNEKEYIEVDKGELAGALSKVAIAAGFNDLRPEINSVLVIVENSLVKFAATDSFRLAEAKLPPGSFKNHIEKSATIIVPLKTADIIMKMAKDSVEGDKIALFFENNQVMARSENAQIISRVIDGKFPDYEAIIPKKIGVEAVFSRGEFVSALKLANSFTARLKEVRVKLIDGKILEVYSSDNSLGENKYLIPAKTKGGSFDIAFNLKYLLDGVKVEDAEQVYLGVNEDNKPAVLKTPNSENYFYILMPVKS